jgi:hypothetical protein
MRTAYTVLALGVFLYVGLVTGASWVGAQEPTHYSEGYCAALNGVRLSDEACNVDGLVVPVVVVEVK